MSKQPTFITIADAAELLGVTDRSIRKWIAEGRLRGYRVGRHIRVDVADVYAFARPIPTGGDAA